MRGGVRTKGMSKDGLTFYAYVLGDKGIILVHCHVNKVHVHVYAVVCMYLCMYL